MFPGNSTHSVIFFDPMHFSQECIDNCENDVNALSLVESLPDLNKELLIYLVQFLKVCLVYRESTIDVFSVTSLEEWLSFITNRVQNSSRPPAIFSTFL